MILSESRSLPGVNAGTFYGLSKSKKKLQFTSRYNATMNEHSGGRFWGENHSLKPLDLCMTKILGA